MSLLNRKARPLARDVQSLRDDRLFIVACDDTYAPLQYFEFFRLSRIQVHVVPTTDGTSVASRVLDRLLQFEHEADDELWMLLDTDHCTKGAHLGEFTNALRRAEDRNVRVALSNPCFEFWLLLHHLDGPDHEQFSMCVEVETRLRVILGEYNKKALRSTHYPLSSVAKACRHAERLDAMVTGGKIPTANTSRVYQLWKAIAHKALPSQLPVELRFLLP
jgi:hypothetical protein